MDIPLGRDCEEMADHEVARLIRAPLDQQLIDMQAQRNKWRWAYEVLQASVSRHREFKGSLLADEVDDVLWQAAKALRRELS